MNAETKWTPGPWARIDTPDYAEIHPASGKAKSPIALVGRAEDADLIAAAPEMAEALMSAPRPEANGPEADWYVRYMDWYFKTRLPALLKAGG